MATQITLGSFGQLNGKNVLTGGSTQLDTKGIIEALVEARRQPAVRLETKNETLDDQTKAYNELKTLFKKFQTAADTLRNTPGVAVESKNIFQYRTASLTSSTGISSSNYVDVTVQPGAAAQTYTINSITQLAQATKQQSGVFSVADSTTASAVTAGPTPGLFQAGTFNLRAVDGTVGGIAITLNTGDSLQTVANKINEVSSRTGIQASILTESTGSYRIIFSATKTGTTYGFNFNTASPAAGYAVENDPTGVLSQVTFNVPNQVAQDAMFSVDGVALVRESNSVSDVINGLTFNLKQATVPGTIDVSIKPDTTMVSNAITQFADAYNEFRIFAARQSQLDEDSKPLEDAVLYTSSVLRNIASGINTEVNGVVKGIIGTNPASLLDLGLTLEDYEGDDETPPTGDILVLNTEKLNSLLQSNFDGVRKVFEYQQSSDNTNFVSYKRSNNLNGVTSFSVAIDRTLNTYKATYTDPTTALVTTVDFDYTALAGGGVGLKGQAGTIFEGAEFVYAVAGDATVNVSVTQGIGDRFYNLLEGYVNDSTGIVSQEVDIIAESKNRNKEEIDTIDEKIDRYREQLIQQYATLESAITKANQILQLLDAQASARNSG
jgi:flagellar hook-associated protein 2